MKTTDFTVPFAGFLLLLGVSDALTADWPMWRYNAYRAAASPESLPAELHLQWTRQYSPRVQVWEDPLNHDLMPYDKVLEPVVMGDRLFVGFNDTDKVVALDIQTGEEVWAFYSGGPVRFPPVAWQGKVYFTSDDGCLYCVSANDGQLKWKFRGGPSERKVLGNERMISAWPARGGPVLRDGRVYFAASIWPFMGTFIYALDAETGTIAWVNDGTGAQFIKQPHSAPAFAGIAPQGALVATENSLLVPGGRSVPAAFDRRTGEFLYYHLNDGGKGNGGSFVAADETDFFVHTRVRGVRAYDLKTGKASKYTVNEPVLDGKLLYAAAEKENVKIVQAVQDNVVWELPVDASGDLIKAGDRLYGAGAGSLTAIDLPVDGGQPLVAWSLPIEGEVLRLLAANGKLFAVTVDGRILAFGSDQRDPATLSVQKRPGQRSSYHAAKAKAIIDSTDAHEGYALWFGVEDGLLLEALVAQSNLRIIAVDTDARRVDRLRRRLDAAGIYGSRISVHTGDPLTFKAPPYIANLIGVSESVLLRLRDEGMVNALFESVRPYGGAVWLPITSERQPDWIGLIEAAKLERSKLKPSRDQLLVVREGPLPEAADWTHQYGDIANTVKSDDARIRAPLGLLWFGGTSNMDVLPRHGHGPPEQVIGGRAFIQGMNSISARDVYTGRQLWQAKFENLGTHGIYYDASYTNTPLSTAYNQKHIPGANGRGSNMIAADDALYVAIGSSCHILDARTGKIRNLITLTPKAEQSRPPDWGYIGIHENILLAGDGFAHYTQKFGDNVKTNTIEDFSASDGLVGFDRNSGQILWRITARHGFLHNGIVAGNGRIYCLDKLPQSAEDKLKRRGAEPPSDYRIAAFDAQTGNLLWEDQRNVFGTWLSYSKQHDILLLAGAKASDRLRDEAGKGMAAYRGESGSVLWQELERSYTGPCILHNDLILTSANSYQASSGAFNLLTGLPHLVANPLTGKLEPWRVSRSHGCNSIIASEHLLTFRSGAAGFYDLLSKSGTANLGGFRSGCTANLVVANGVLNAPDHTRTCSCAYQNQTSLALVHMPDIEMWTYSQFGIDAEDGDRIERVGINFGAPGDRRAEDGTLWLEYPSVGGDSPGLGISVNGGKTVYFRRHTSQIVQSSLPWVAASGVRDFDSITITPEIIRTVVKKPVPSKTDDDERPASAKAVDAKPAADTNRPPAVVQAETPPPQPPTPRVHAPRPYTVRLHFVEPDDVDPGQRTFSVSLQGERVLENFDVLQTAGGRHRAVVKEFNGVVVEKNLTVDFARATGTQAGPVVCGIELIAEQPTAGN